MADAGVVDETVTVPKAARQASRSAASRGCRARRLFDRQRRPAGRRDILWAQNDPLLAPGNERDGRRYVVAPPAPRESEPEPLARGAG